MNPHPLTRARRYPHTCIWEITGACNLECRHCGNVSGVRSDNELPIEHLLEVAEHLAELECQVVEVTGGEPLLHADWEKLCRRLSQLGMKVALISNGTLVDDDAIERMLEAGVGHVAISIDGLREVHDATRALRGERNVTLRSPFDAAMDALGKVVGRLPVTAITQVNQHNFGELEALQHCLAEVGVERWQLQLAVPTGRLRDSPEPYIIEPEDLEALTRFIAESIERGRRPAILTSDTIGYYTDREVLLRRRPDGQGFWVGCMAGFRSVAITYDGMVRGCSLMPPEFDAGDLHTETLKEIWSDEERFSYTTRFDEANLTGGCGRCKFGPLCRAGCTSMAYWVTGTIYDNPYCLHRVRELDR